VHGRRARTDAMAAIQKEMGTLQDRWYASVTEFHTNWYRLLSQLQPYGHAAAVAAKGEDWLPEVRTYVPSPLVQSKYLALMYNLPAMTHGNAT
jgi:hypothetical protein